MLLEDAECISLQTVVFIYSGKDRPLFIMQDFLYLVICLFPLPILKQVRASFVMYERHLREQVVDLWDISFFCQAYFHL